jgi:peptide/nickel transport system substrate-binding protein
VASLARVRDDAPEGELGTSGVYAGYLQGAAICSPTATSASRSTPAPMADLLDVLVELFVVPARHLAHAATTPPGSGPFRLVEAGGRRVVMEAHAAPGTATHGCSGSAGSPSPIPSARVRRLREGGADLASDVPVGTDRRPHDLAPEQRRHHLHVRPDRRAHLGPARAARPQPRRRRDGPDRRALRRAGGADHQPLHLHPARLRSGLAPYAFDPGLARRLLAEAGGRARADLRRAVAPPGRGAAAGAAPPRQLADVGVTLHVVEHADRPGYATSVRTKRIHDAACFDSSPHSTFRLFMEKFHAGARGPWWLGYDDPAFDASSTTRSVGRRRMRAPTAYRRAARMLRDDAPWLFLYGPHLGWGLGDRAAPGSRPPTASSPSPRRTERPPWP